ncbi:hypothetical protein GX51_04801 [Blastomyces parvus]|uniref:Uncharacterized protein n=1 Tax=Blastomyces parvus TaxID=2060905 RepID=A0A2B7WZV3_9EURO|nr:hypothetical protein GX51_04801 [Blastomyces parvus]
MALQRGLGRPGLVGFEQACGHCYSCLRTIKSLAFLDQMNGVDVTLLTGSARAHWNLKGALEGAKRKPTKTAAKAPLWSNKQTEIVDLAEISMCAERSSPHESRVSLWPRELLIKRLQAPLLPLVTFTSRLFFLLSAISLDSKAPMDGKNMRTGSLSCRSPYPSGSPDTPALTLLHQNKIGKWMRTRCWVLIYQECSSEYMEI